MKRLWEVVVLAALVGCGGSDAPPTPPPSPAPSAAGATATRTPRPTAAARTPIAAEPDLKMTLGTALTPTGAPIPTEPAIVLPDFYRLVGDFDDYRPEAISANGERIVLVGLENNALAIQLLDTNSGEMTAIHKEGWNWAPSISADGSTVAFISYSETLAGGGCTQHRAADGSEEIPGCGSLYVYDAASQTLSRTPLGSWLGLGAVDDTALNGEGRYVAFLNGWGESGISLLDRETGIIETLADDVVNVDISADGMFLAYVRMIPQGERPATFDVFLLDRESGQTTRLTHSEGGEHTSSGAGWFQSEGVFSEVQISGDGRYVLFGSNVPDLTGPALPNCPENETPCWHTYLYDRESGTIELISANDAGEPANTFFTNLGGISRDGRYIAFASGASNLTDQTIPAGMQPYLRDRETGRTVWVPANQHSAYGWITGEMLVIQMQSYYGRTSRLYLVGLADLLTPP